MIRWRLNVAFEGVEAHIGLALQQKTRIQAQWVGQSAKFLDFGDSYRIYRACLFNLGFLYYY